MPEEILNYAVDGEILAFLVLVMVPVKAGKKKPLHQLSEEEQKRRRRTERQKAVLLGAAVTVLMWIAFLYFIHH